MKMGWTPLLLLLGACTHSNPWRLDSISTGDRAFDSKKLSFINHSIKTPLTFEMVRIADRVDAFLSLTQFRWHGGPSQTVKAIFSIDGDQLEEAIPILEGRMRLKLPADLTQNLIHALKEGKKVGILIDGYEETLDAEQFAPIYSQFVGNSIFGDFE